MNEVSHQSLLKMFEFECAWGGFTCSAFHIIREPIRALKYHRSLQHHSIEKSSVCDKDLFCTR